jgi:hypothetical protein
MSDQVLTIFMIVFIILGVYNVFSGLRRQREAQARGERMAWYQQISLLTGLEYLLLSFVFILSLNIRNKTLPSSLQSVLVPVYLLVLLSSAVLAGFVIRQAIINARRSRQLRSAQANRNEISNSRTDEADDNDLTSGQRATNLQHRRERRQKAAAARRRRSGRG